MVVCEVWQKEGEHQFQHTVDDIDRRYVDNLFTGDKQSPVWSSEK